MDIHRINGMIAKALEDEERTGRLAGVCRQIATQNGVRPSDQDIAQIVDFVKGYVAHVPIYLTQGLSAAEKVGLGVEMNQMASALEEYWVESHDLMPDHQGLVGIMDDAYASLVLFDAVSEYCRATLGRPIIEHDIKMANQSMRGLIGEPIASELDQRVGMTIGQAMMQRILQQVAAGGGFSFGGGVDPVWGGASMDEVVTARLGAMGVVF
jgi:hypothetical protein